MQTLLIPLAILFCHGMGLLSAMHAVMRTRTAQGAIAWLISLVVFPYLAVPAYWIFGRSRFHGYVSARRAGHQELNELALRAHKSVNPYLVPDHRKGETAQAAERLAGIPLLTGNEAALLVDGQAAFESILNGIDSAQSYILFQFFIVHDDQIGREVQARLIRRAKAGVRVYFLYDEVGCHDLPRAYLDQLRAAGAEVHDFHTRKGPHNRFQINFRNHRKIVVVDGKEAWIGGHNVGDEYLGRNPKFGHWRDTHVRITGPSALAAQLSFIEDWRWATNAILDLDWRPQPSAKQNLPVLIVPSGPADVLETAALMFTHALNSAKKRIWITSPYFVPDEAVLTALQLAGLRGVDVRVLIPDKPDHLLVFLAAFSYFDDAGRTGVQFYRYTDGFLHQKVMVIDEVVATVGTANFDNRSFRLNFEITAAIADRDFVAEVAGMLETDFSKSRKMIPADYDKKPYWFKLCVRLARLTSPIQ